MGQIAATALQRQTMCGIDLLGSTHVIHRHGFHVSSFILGRFACSWPKIWYIIQNFVISTRILYCTVLQGLTSRSVEHMCVSNAIVDVHVEV